MLQGGYRPSQNLAGFMLEKPFWEITFSRRVLSSNCLFSTYVSSLSMKTFTKIITLDRSSNSLLLSFLFSLVLSILILHLEKQQIFRVYLGTNVGYFHKQPNINSNSPLRFQQCTSCLRPILTPGGQKIDIWMDT